MSGPEALTSREDEVLRAVGRWVTLVGPAGTGKTRLALEVAARIDATPITVDLAHAVERDVPRTVARAIGVGPDATGPLLGTAAVVLASRDHLLVLDNCDRVLAAARDVVAQRLALAPSVSVLATSRSPLGGTDESVYPLPPLPAGEADSAAVELFLDRARAAAPRVQLSVDDNVLRLCQRLDGLPLAIELAAARLRHLPVSELSRRLAADFGALRGVDATDRHDTLETAFAWSWELLDHDERDVLSRLAALPRGFVLEMVDVLFGTGASEVTLRLLEKSLVSEAAARGGVTRFRLLESLRAFVLARTAEELVADVLARHAEYFADIAGLLSSMARVDDSTDAKATADRMCPDVNAALMWSLGQGHRELAMRLARALATGVEQYGPDIDSLDALTQAARDPWLQRNLPARDLLNLGVALSLGDLELVASLSAVAFSRADDDDSRLAAECLAAYAAAYADRGELALIHASTAEKLALTVGDTWMLAAVHQARATALSGPSLAQPDAALDAFESALQTYALAGDAMHVNICRYLMAATAAEAGIRTKQALGWAEQCITYTTASNDQHELAHALLTRNTLVSDSSLEELKQVADAFRAVGDLHCLTRTYLRMADLVGDDRALDILRQAASMAHVARHVGREADSLERIIRLTWTTGHRHAAAVALGELRALVGDTDAMARCPEGLRNQVVEWSAAIAEGRARAISGAMPEPASPVPVGG